MALRCQLSSEVKRSTSPRSPTVPVIAAGAPLCELRSCSRCARSVRTRATTSLIRSGLGRKSSAPACSAAARVAGSRSAFIRRIGSAPSRASARTDRQTERPSSPGRLTSHSSASSCVRCSLRSTSAPSEAVVTAKPALRSATSRMRKLRGSASATSRLCLAKLDSSRTAGPPYWKPWRDGPPSVPRDAGASGVDRAWRRARRLPCHLRFPKSSPDRTPPPLTAFPCRDSRTRSSSEDSVCFGSSSSALRKASAADAGSLLRHKTPAT